MIKDITNYLVWIDLAKELYLIGDLVVAKDLLAEAYKHALIIANNAAKAEIHLYQGNVFHKLKPKEVILNLKIIT